MGGTGQKQKCASQDKGQMKGTGKGIEKGDNIHVLAKNIIIVTGIFKHLQILIMHFFMLNDSKILF